MAEFKLFPFRTTRIVQSQIQEFLHEVSLAILSYQEGIATYLEEGFMFFVHFVFMEKIP